MGAKVKTCIDCSGKSFIDYSDLVIQCQSCKIDALLPKLRKGGWRMIHPPTHVYYFSPKTISRLMARHGLVVESVKHRSVSRNVGSVLNQLIGNRKAINKNTALFETGYKLATQTRLHKVNLPINTYDIMEVVAYKA